MGLLADGVTGFGYRSCIGGDSKFIVIALGLTLIQRH
jgi:hypothetical protein